jgi:phosphoglycerate dehydrogenase-like enzyme
MAAGVEWALVPELPSRVIVTRSPGVFGPWMAEYVAGWLFWVTQRTETYRAAQRRGEWNDRVVPDRLAGKTLVVVGLGDIGREIARTARGLGLRVVGVSRDGRTVPGAERVFRARDLRRALALADFAVVVLPLTAATRGLIGERELAALRPHAWLVNVGRGAVLDEGALVDALHQRRLGGAILDVFATEPLPAGHPLWGLDNAVVTPHISGANRPGELAPLFNDNLARWLGGRRLRHVVDRARGY